jgi:hypothetical protein
MAIYLAMSCWGVPVLLNAERGGGRAATRSGRAKGLAQGGVGAVPGLGGGGSVLLRLIFEFRCYRASQRNDKCSSVNTMAY